MQRELTLGRRFWVAEKIVSISLTAHFPFPLLSRIIVLVNFVECLCVSGPILKHFAYRNPCYPPNNPIKYYYSHFPNKGTEAQRSYKCAATYTGDEEGGT